MNGREPPPDAGFGRLIGLEVTERAAGESRCTLGVGPHRLNPHGTVHGGVLYSLADQGMGAAVYTLLGEDESCATIEIKMVYLAAVREGTLDCRTRVLHKGRRLVVLESEVMSGEKLAAKALGSFAIFPAGR